MTNLDLTHPIRGAIITALKADSALTAIVPAQRVYPQTVPASVVFPFLKFGAPITTPRHIDGKNGTDMSAAIHVFTKKVNGAADPEGLAMTVNAHVVRILDAIEDVDIGDGLTLDIVPRQGQVIQDDDADCYHGFVLFDATAS